MAQANPNSNQQGNIMQRAMDYVRGNQPNNQDRGTRQNNTQQQANSGGQGNNQQNNNRQEQQQQNNQNNGDLNNPENRQTPFAAYEGLWDNVDTNGEQAPDFNLDSKVIDGTADRLDFMRDMPEDMQEGLTQAFGDNLPHIIKALNHLGRKAYATSVTHNTALTDKYLKVKDGFSQKGLGRSIKEQMVLTGIASHEAAQKNPVIREMLSMIGSKLARLHPDATPDWIRDKAFDFVKEVNGAMFPTPQDQQQQEAKQPGGADFDWNTWAKSDIKRDA